MVAFFEREKTCISLLGLGHEDITQDHVCSSGRLSSRQCAIPGDRSVEQYVGIRSQESTDVFGLATLTTYTKLPMGLATFRSSCKV